jgi:undecaprenyl diphosphate synthase
MKNAIPKHIGIIMDGNRRWAKENNSQSIVGHKKGLDTAEEICIYSSKIGIQYLTLYAFSAQNWSRSKVEIDSLFTLFLEFFNTKSNFFMEYEMKFNPIGRIDELNTSIIDKILTLVEKTKNNKGMCVNVAINYGGREEIIDAIKNLYQRNFDFTNIDEVVLKENTYLSSNQPDPELIIRTGGISRLSNFLLWHAAYSEIIVHEKLWPEFTQLDFQDCINQYSTIDRKFGGATSE